MPTVQSQDGSGVSFVSYHIPGFIACHTRRLFFLMIMVVEVGEENSFKWKKDEQRGSTATTHSIVRVWWYNTTTNRGRLRTKTHRQDNERKENNGKHNWDKSDTKREGEAKLDTLTLDKEYQKKTRSMRHNQTWHRDVEHDRLRTKHTTQGRHRNRTWSTETRITNSDMKTWLIGKTQKKTQKKVKWSTDLILNYFMNLPGITENFILICLNSLSVLAVYDKCL